MIRRSIILSAVLLFFCPAVSPADCLCGDCSTKSVTGEVQKVDLDINRLYVKDEITKEGMDFFVDENTLKPLNRGDRVRVYYECPQLPAISVKTMTPVGPVSSPFIIELKMTSRAYRPSEELDGELGLINKKGAELPAVLEFKFFRQGTLAYSTTVNVPRVFPGTNHYLFRDLGLMGKLKNLKEPGQWYLEVTHQNTTNTAGISFSVMDR